MLLPLREQWPELVVGELHNVICTINIDSPPTLLPFRPTQILPKRICILHLYATTTYDVHKLIPILCGIILGTDNQT